jgi:uncharacterized membrane protein (UPF0127 family)
MIQWIITLFLAAAVNVPVKLPSGKVLNVELANTPEQLGKGLIGRTSLPPDSGLLLVYRGAVRTKFNLFGYQMPVDILYLDESKTVIYLQENLAPCRTAAADCGYDSIWMYRYALQVPAGTVKRLNIHGGEVLSFEVPADKSNDKK